MFLCGRRVVAEALRGKRPIEKIFFQFGAEGTTLDEIRREAKKHGVPCSQADRAQFAQLEREARLERGGAQGVIALAAPYIPITLEQAVEAAYIATETPVFVLLDELHDPQNIGAIARSAAGAGVNALILPAGRSASFTPSAVKASAGALEHLSIVKTDALAAAVKDCKAAGFFVLGTDSPAPRQYSEPLYNQPVLLIVGNEHRGISPDLKKLCDAVAEIPLSGNVASLNASVAAAIVLFEMCRQRKNNKTT